MRLRLREEDELDRPRRPVQGGPLPLPEVRPRLPLQASADRASVLVPELRRDEGGDQTSGIEEDDPWPTAAAAASSP